LLEKSLPIHTLVVSSRLPNDPRAAGLLADAHALGLTPLANLECHDLFFIEGDVSPSDLDRLATQLLTDPVIQTAHWREPSSARTTATALIEVALRPGVTDSVAEQICRCAHELGIIGVERAATGQRYLIRGNVQTEDLHWLARRLLANAVIQRYTLGKIEPVFPHPAEASGEVEVIQLRSLSPANLGAVATDRRTALDQAEMQAIQAYYQAEGRDPTDIELEAIAQTWSEHCVHKTFKALIEIQPSAGTDADFHPPIDGILNTYLRSATEQIAAPWVLSAFVDNAGVIAFDDEYEVSFKVETHNHPSAIEPFGGANTGVGGVIRDILGVSAKPIAATDVLCFGPQATPTEALPEGVLHPGRIRSGVVAGVQDYGNKIGIPTVNGAIVYDPAYTANPLVYCGCVGLAPRTSHPRTPQLGDRLILLGGSTGRDGLRGATFSSMTMDAQTGEVSGASVQIGAPITEKGLIEVVLRARDQRLYHAITDCGAGGLSSAVGEMTSGCGGEVELEAVRLKYPGLAPWEIWLSEAQERMVLAVSPANLGKMQALCDIFDVTLTDIGAFTNSGRLVVRYGGRTVLDLANHFLHDGLPRRSLVARPAPSPARPSAHNGPAPSVDFNNLLLTLLAHPNIASKADIIRLYDHEVQGGTVVKPLTGAQNDGPSDACVLKPLGTAGMRGLVLSNGINPALGKVDAYRMAVSVIDEAIRNAVAVGANPDQIALLDNFCWGDPLRPETLGSLVEAARGCYEGALYYRTPFISGKDSLNNEYLGADGQRHAIPPSLLISAIGIIEDVNQAVTMDLKQPGNMIYLLGATLAEFGGSHLTLTADLPPAPFPLEAPSLPANAPAIYRALHQAIRANLVCACHDLSEGGLAVAAAEMCIGGRLGMALTLEGGDPLVLLFSESNGRLLVEVQPAHREAFEAHFAGHPESLVKSIGTVTNTARLSISSQTGTLINLACDDLVRAWSPA
jgi:phosphoribosylformylglycinamidine synthase subunit PurSL